MPRSRNPQSSRPDTEETRKAILRAAHDLFMEFGYRGVTTRMVADACGIKQPLLYYHFADKEALYLEVHRELAVERKAALERIAARRSETLPERLRHVVQYLQRSRQQNMGMFFHDMRHEMSPTAQQKLKDFFQSSIVFPIMSIFEDGLQSGFLRPLAQQGVPPRLATYLLLSAISSLPESTELQDGEERSSRHVLWEDHKDMAEAIVQALLYGMVTQPVIPSPDDA